jgi:hypothetical protein
MQRTRICVANNYRKYDITFAPKEQREAVRQLVYLVLTRDMSTFNSDRFKHWLKETDTKFRKVSLMLKFEIRDRFVYFRVSYWPNHLPVRVFNARAFRRARRGAYVRGIEPRRTVKTIALTKAQYVSGQ